MSRTRSLGRYKGASFAEEFKSHSKGFSPMFKGPSNAMQDQMDDMVNITEQMRNELRREREDSEIHERKEQMANNKPTSEDTVPERLGDRRASIDSYKAGAKKAKEEAEAAKLAEEEAEAEKEKLMEEYTKDGYTDDYKEGMTSKEAKLEHKENKGELKDRYKVAKGEAKDRKKSGEITGKEFRAIKKEEKSKKKASKTSSKCKKKAAQGKSGKKWYAKNCT